MKKTYIQPTTLTVNLQHMQMLCESITDVEGGDLEIGGEGNEPARVKSANIWDEEW